MSAAGVSNAAWEAQEMMAAALGDSKVLVPLHYRDILSLDRLAAWESLVSGRCARRPLAHLLGEWDFDGLRLVVRPGVLVPRPETEELLEFVVQKLKERGGAAASVLSAADIGTGSGCLAVAMAKRWPRALVWAVDVSATALAVARRNAEVHGVARRIFFLVGDLMTRLSGGLHLDVVVANLPYVDEEEMPFLDPEVRREPSLALNGGRGGLDLIRRLIVQARERLSAGGRLFLEIGHDQAAAVTGFLRDQGFREIETGRDSAGIERFVMGGL
jgi:release factor glutamine methyltransferase